MAETDTFVVRTLAALHAPESADREEPEPGSGQVAVDPEAIDVNFPDILHVDGRCRNRLPPPPFEPGLGGAAQDSLSVPRAEGRSEPEVKRLMPLSRYSDSMETLLEGRCKGRSILVTREE